MLLNLVTNAVKFTDRGHVTVRIAFVEGDDRTVRLMFAVEDTGIGIPKEKQRHIFESFTQADASTTRKYGGTGLGTTIARDLTHLMGGKLELQSTAGEGSQFWLILSFDRTEGAPLPAQEADIKHPKPPLPGSIHGLILVAEDYPINQEIIRTQLENDGHSVELAENGLEAVKAAERRPFDLIFMDIHMPELDGFDATRRIRSTDNPNKGTPIIALTASAERLTREECLRAGMDEVLTKPIRSGPLLAALQDWLGKARNPSSGAPPVDAAIPGTM
ncbi:MAG: response regulator, partial [Rectinemataceae bacterium]